jgi:hypothetical protein
MRFRRESQLSNTSVRWQHLYRPTSPVRFLNEQTALSVAEAAQSFCDEISIMSRKMSAGPIGEEFELEMKSLLLTVIAHCGQSWLQTDSDKSGRDGLISAKHRCNLSYINRNCALEGE